MKRYVNADYTIKALSIFSDKKNGNQDFLNGIETAKEVINNQSTTDVRKNIHVQKVIGGGERDGATCWFECSHCHGTVDLQDMFCKHCGAVLEYEK